jgi:alpha-ribazole phosphatase
MSTGIYLIRHGETDWNVNGRWQGQADIPLNEKGKIQALEVAGKLKNSMCGAIYSSDLIRARQTAEVISKTLLISSIYYDSRLREIHQGLWEGLSIIEIREQYKVEFQRRQENPWLVSPPGGETAQQVQERVTHLIDEIKSREAGKNVAVVTHGFVIAVILSHYQQIPVNRVWDLVPGNGDICRIDFPD